MEHRESRRPKARRRCARHRSAVVAFLGKLACPLLTGSRRDCSPAFSPGARNPTARDGPLRQERRCAHRRINAATGQRMPGHRCARRSAAVADATEYCVELPHRHAKTCLSHSYRCRRMDRACSHRRRATPGGRGLRRPCRARPAHRRMRSSRCLIAAERWTATRRCAPGRVTAPAVRRTLKLRRSGSPPVQ
jgi:hypothetical protein